MKKASKQVHASLDRSNWLKNARLKQVLTNRYTLGLIIVLVVFSVVVVSRAAVPRIGVRFGLQDSSTTGNATTSTSSVSFGTSSGTTSVAFRNSNAMYGAQATVASAQLDLTKNLQAASPDLNYFKSTYRPGGDGGEFRTWCSLSHISKDDPIVFPGKPDAAHLHMFYGNTATNAFSSPMSIINSGGGSCSGFEANRSSYWFPVMLDKSGKTRVPNLMNVYYKTETIAQPSEGYSTIPQGLEMLAGNSKATTPQPVYFNDGWGCNGDMFQSPTDSLIPSCSGASGKVLFLKLLFPRCWDGLPIDMSAHDYVAHVVYPSAYYGGTCDAAHPKVLPEIEVLMQWELSSSETTDGWFLSSDITDMSTMAHKPGGTTKHGDYIAGWHKDVVGSWVRDCLNAQWNCQTDILSNKVNTPIQMGGQYVKLKETNFQIYDKKGPMILDLKH